MDKIPKTFESYINKITQKVTYLDKYGGSVVVTGVILVVFLLQNRTDILGVQWPIPKEVCKY